MIPIALARSCFCIGRHARFVVVVVVCLFRFFVSLFLFVWFGFIVLREITQHSRRALVPEKGQWVSCVGVLSPGAALHTTRRSTLATYHRPQRAVLQCHHLTHTHGCVAVPSHKVESKAVYPITRTMKSTTVVKIGKITRS